MSDTAKALRDLHPIDPDIVNATEQVESARLARLRVIGAVQKDCEHKVRAWSRSRSSLIGTYYIRGIVCLTCGLAHEGREFRKEPVLDYNGAIEVTDFRSLAINGWQKEYEDMKK